MPQIGDDVRGCKLLDRSRNFAARFYLQLAVGDCPENVANSANQQPFADREFALKAAPHVGMVGRGLPLESTSLGDDHVLAVRQYRRDAALDDETIARSNFAG